MALVLADRVQETTTTSGTGTVTLSGAVAGFQSFGTAIGNANTTYYTLVDGNNWEVGIGTYTSSGTTLSRDTVLASSAGGTTKITLSGGTTTVFVTYPAERAVGTDVTQTLTNKTISGASNTITNVSLTTGVTGTLPVANGGTGVTVSSGASSVALRDSNANITANYFYPGFSNTAAAGTTTTLTAASVFNYVVTGSGGQTFKLPDATTLSAGAVYTFNNNQSSGTIVVQNNSTTTVVTVQSGGVVYLTLLTNSIAAGTWDTHYVTPSNASWSTNTLSWAGSITNATWNGVAVGVAYGGTGAATLAANNVLLGNGTSALQTVAPGTSGNVLTSDGTTWGSSTPSGLAQFSALKLVSLRL